MTLAAPIRHILPTVALLSLATACPDDSAVEDGNADDVADESGSDTTTDTDSETDSDSTDWGSETDSDSTDWGSETDGESDSTDDGGGPLCEAVGQDCDASLDQPDDYLCLDLDDDGLGSCRLLCDPPGVGDPEPCGVGSLCAQSQGVPPYCIISDCDHFFDPGLCVEGQDCAPYAPDLWLCTPSGDGQLNEPCVDNTGCDTGLLCSQFGRCVEPDCAPSMDDCGLGEICQPFSAWGAPLDLGQCQITCNPWDPIDDGCDPGEWCLPGSLPGSMGGCVSGGFAGEGAFCDDQTPDTTCFDGMVCGANQTCFILCLDGAVDEPGDTCSGFQGCEVPQVQDQGGDIVSWEFGFCAPN